jgi:O-antigen/teichoic acid export membrane protein
MFRRLLRDSVIYSASTALARGVQIILIPVYTRLLGPAEFGVVEMVAVFGALVNLTVALEISQGVARYLADARDESVRRSYASTGVIFSVGAYGTFALVSVALATSLATLLFGSDQWAYALRIGIAALAINGLFTLLQDLLRWRLAPGAYLFASMAYTLGNVGVGIYLVAFASAGIAGVLWGQVAGAVAGAAVAWFCMTDFVVISFDLGRLKEMLGYSGPLVLSGVAVFANQFIDRIVVKELLGIDSLGIYGVAARFASALGLATIALQAALTPLVYQRYRDAGTPREIARIFRCYCAVMAPVLGALALFSPEVISVFSGPAYRAAQDVLPVLAVASLLTTLYIFAPGSFLEKRTGVVAGINMIAAGLNLMLNLILVPAMGIRGAAVATCCAAAIAFSGFMMSSQKLYHVPHAWTRIGNAAVIALVMIGAGVWFNGDQRGLQPELLAVKSFLICAAVLVSASYVLNPDDRESARRWLATGRASA